MRFYLIPTDALAFDDETALAAHIGAKATNGMLVVKGVALQPKMQLALLPVGPQPVPTPRPARTVPEPTDKAAVAAVLEFYAPGMVASKRKHSAETGMAVDTASNIIDWLTQTGVLVKCDNNGVVGSGKCYKRASEEKAT